MWWMALGYRGEPCSDDWYSVVVSSCADRASSAIGAAAFCRQSPERALVLQLVQPGWYRLGLEKLIAAGRTASIGHDV